MKKKFSKAWKASKQARKQRKYLANAPRNIIGKMLSSHLSKELRQKYTRRSFQIRKGDTVKVMNGESKGKTGKVSSVDAKNLRVAIEGLQATKKDGSKVNLFFKASNLMITELVLDDKRRLDSLKKENTEKVQTKKQKTEEKK
jgi:large subunit ribosomal protein L24